MLRAIEFKDKRFRTKEDYNLLSPLTIILKIFGCFLIRERMK